MKHFTGIAAAPGIAIGRAFLHREEDFPEIPRYTLRKSQIEGEWERFKAALAEAAGEIRGLEDRAARETGRKQAEIFTAHLLMLEDPEFQDQLRGRLAESLQNMEWVIGEVSREISQKLKASPEPVFQERAADIADVSQRLIYKLLGVTKYSLSDLSEDVILAAHDLLPSELLSMNRARVKGIAMDMGGRTSHTAILARAFDIPAVLGLSSVSHEISPDHSLVVDGDAGKVIVNPDKKTLLHYEKAIGRRQKRVEESLALGELPAETTDGRRVSLKANIEVPEEAEQLLRYGAEGIGLYRSEFLFLIPGQFPDEERQYQAYTQVLKALGSRPVTIRTVDLGGDKVLPEMQKAGEKNPLLGWRAIRFSLALPEVFKTQLRALLRSGLNGNLRIMFPMISGIEELEGALALLEEARAECRLQKKAYAEDIEVGTMIEIPSAAMTADILASRSAFLSLGTNDLIQYSLAVDRGNERVNYLAQPCHPAVLRLIKNTIDAAHQRGIPAAMCGEMAGDPAFTAILLGLGLDEFSMTASGIPPVKRIIRGVALESCRALAAAALNCVSYREVEALSTAWLAEHCPAP
jgi:phosphotransferase system enzyme I (PtsI)